MTDIKKVNGFTVATFTEIKDTDIDMTRVRTDTKVFDSHGNRVGFFRETVFNHFDGNTVVHKMVMEPHAVFDTMGMEEGIEHFTRFSV